jgi:hypothetical protein
MDDFLHNLRSGKLKQVDRSNRPYNDQQFKGGPRRNLDHRNKGRYENKDTFDRLNPIKEVLESLVESQKQMTEAYQARTRAEERKARAMEIIAKNLYRMLNPNATDVDEVFAFQESEPPIAHAATQRDRMAVQNTPESPSDAYSDEADEMETAEATSEKEEALNVEAKEREVYAGPSEDVTDEEADEDEEEFKTADEDRTGSSGRLKAEDRRMLFKLIDRMRAEGQGWEKIARNLAAQGHPTISGKGTWRGIMVKNLHEKMASS